MRQCPVQRLMQSCLLVLCAVWALSACAAGVPGPEIAPESTAATAFRVGVVFDARGREGGMLNQAVWQGLAEAHERLDAEIAVREAGQEGGISEQIVALATAGQDVILVVGEDGAFALKTAAPRYPGQPFLLVDAELAQADVSSLTFDLAQPAFLAGYLAAGVSGSGVVCTFAEIENEEAIAVMQGFSAGVRYFNLQKGAEVSVAGWDSGRGEGAFTHGYAADQHVRLAQTLFDAGCDVLLPVIRDGVNEVAALAAQRHVALIGMHGDGYRFAPAQGGVWLTSLQKNAGSVIFEAIQTLAGGGTVQDFSGSLDNGGVALAPLHEWEGAVSESLQMELVQLRADLVGGALDPQ